MAAKKTRLDATQKAKILAELHRDQALRQQGYRERALKMFPHLCARCGRELEGKRLKELTIHHKDHDHDNNPPDGSNWELLCVYCHDHEHEKTFLGQYYTGAARAADTPPAAATFQPFSALDTLLKRREEPPSST